MRVVGCKPSVFLLVGVGYVDKIPERNESQKGDKGNDAQANGHPIACLFLLDRWAFIDGRFLAGNRLVRLGAGLAADRAAVGEILAFAAH